MMSTEWGGGLKLNGIKYFREWSSGDPDYDRDHHGQTWRNFVASLVEFLWKLPKFGGYIGHES